MGIEGPLALTIGIVGGIALLHVTKVAERVAVAGDFLVIVGSLIGIVFAAFALVIAFLSESYLIQLERNPKGVRAFFAPFMVNVGIDVGLVIGTVAYRAAAEHFPHTFEKVYFVVLATLFVYALLNITALSRTVMAHGVTRAAFAEIQRLERELKSNDDPQ